jgi:putative ATP-binding cassette transporter
MLAALSELQRYFTAEDRRQWLVLLGTSLAAGLAQSLTLAFFNHAVAVYGEGRGNLSYLPLVLALTFLGMAAAWYGAVRGYMVSTRMAIRLRDGLLERLGTGNLRLVERVSPSSLHYHLLGTIDNLATAYGTLLGCVTSAVMLVCNFVYVGWLSPAGLVAAMLITLVGVVVHFWQERRVVQRRQRLDHLKNVMSARHREFLDGYKELRLSRERLRDYRSRIDAVNSEFFEQGHVVKRLSTAGELGTNFFQFLMIVLIVFAVPLYTKIDAVTMMQLITAVLVTMGPLSGVVGSIPGFTRARIALDNLRMLEAEIEATHESPRQEAAALAPFESIELRGVEFDFGEGGFRLGPLDLELRRGQVLFVVGGNGSGKTVLLRLISALYHPARGTILYNGAPLREEERQAYRERFSAVFSDFYLFQELLGLPGVRADAADDWLRRLDLAGKTRLEGGAFSSVALSAGQRKRLAFAVAMLEERPICILDEFGAEQDPEHRARFYRELIPVLRDAGKTVIVVSHDDAYFDAGDRVVKMDFGRIVDDSAARTRRTGYVVGALSKR